MPVIGLDRPLVFRLPLLPDASASLSPLGALQGVQLLDRLVRGQGLRGLSLLDVGAGGGDALRAVARWGAQRGFAFDLWGLDRSP